eukprot:756649-Hanusia_phi.AAC.6
MSAARQGTNFVAAHPFSCWRLSSAKKCLGVIALSRLSRLRFCDLAGYALDKFQKGRSVGTERKPDARHA